MNEGDRLAAEICLARGQLPPAAPPLGWVVATVEEVPAGLPLGVVLDLGRLMHRQRIEGPQSLSTGDAELDDLLARYDDHVLGRLQGARRLEALQDAVARLPAHQRPAAVAVCVRALCDRLSWGDEPVAAAAVRRIARLPWAEVVDSGWAALADPGVRARICSTYRRLIEATRRVGQLLGDAEVYILENLDALAGEADRLALREIADASERFGALLPVSVRRRRSRRGDAADMQAEEARYPMGGYAAIMSAGPIENLVPSELAYMEPGARIDPFSVRWASGELLRYARDEGVFRRKRRCVGIVLAPDLDGCRLKAVDDPAQRLVSALGAAAAGVRGLVRWLSGVELRVDIVCPSTSAGARPIASEARLLALILRDERELGIVRFVDQTADPEPLVIDAAQMSGDWAAELGEAFAARA